MEKKEKKSELILDPWQREILQHDGNVLLCTGRQVGKTTIFAHKAAEYMVRNKNAKLIAVSLTEDQAFLMRFMVEDYLLKHYPSYLKVAKKDKPTKNKLTLNNSSTYIVRPVGPSGDAVRGFTGDVLIVDEAAFMPELMWSAAKPTLLTTGGQIWMCSTPNVKEGWFYEQFEACKSGKSSRFKVWHVSSEEVIYKRPISETWTEAKQKDRIQFLEEEKGSMSSIRYGQEYLGLFMEELMRFFSDAWIDRICTQKQEQRLPGREYYLGVDIARLGGDETSFEIIRRINKDNLIHVYDEHRTDTLTTWTEERITQLDWLYSFKKIYIDAGAGSLGVGVFDHLLAQDQTKRKVEAINNRKIVQGRKGFDNKAPPTQRLLKEDLYDNLLWLGETGRIKLLDTDAVRASLRSITKEIVQTRTGISRIVISGTYAHIAEALIRAAWCAKEKDLKLLISSIRI